MSLLDGGQSDRRGQDKSCTPPGCPLLPPLNPPDTFVGLEGAIGRHEYERLLLAFVGTGANDPDTVRLPAGAESNPPAHDAAHDNQVRIDRRAKTDCTTE
jgi:hypothetical protein